MRNSMLLMAVAQAAVLVGIQPTCCSAVPDATADVILVGGKFFTLEDERPLAEALAIRSDGILAVGSRGDVWRHRGASTVVIDLNGAFVPPGFIDSHTHFDYAGQLLLGVNLLDVADAEALAERVDRARARLPDGAWIVGGDWGAHEEWAMGSTGREATSPEGAFPAAAEHDRSGHPGDTGTAQPLGSQRVLSQRGGIAACRDNS